MDLRIAEVVAAGGARGAFAVQVGAYESAINAREMEVQLRRKGYQAWVARVVNAGTTLTAVRFGRYADRSSARAAAERFRGAEGLPAVVRPMRP